MNIHFIGIGGISMSGLAAISLAQGHIVSGSDAGSKNALVELKQKGATVANGHSPENIKPNTELVVYTAAIKHDNPELIQAKKLGIKTQERSEFLGQIMNHYSNSYAVSGTHGKTSTTSMLTSILLEAAKDPTVLVGGNIPAIGGNVRIGNSEHFVAEACEYVDSFLQFFPKTTIILNIEKDHLDYFSGIEHIKNSFLRFAKNTKEGGFIIANGDDDNVHSALQNETVIFFGFKETNDAKIVDLTMDGESSTYSIKYDNQTLGPFVIHIPGVHNVYNSVAAILSAYKNGFELLDIQKGIFNYKGVGRRFEYKGSYHDAKIYDDYAHHPTEIKTTLNAASKLQKNRLIAVFQPHTFTRTKELLDDFVTSFDNADLTIITNIYPSREIDTGLIHSKDLVQKMDPEKTLYLGTLPEVVEYLKNNLHPNDLCFTIGAGNVNEVADSLLK